MVGNFFSTGSATRDVLADLERVRFLRMIEGRMPVKSGMGGENVVIVPEVEGWKRHGARLCVSSKRAPTRVTAQPAKKATPSP